MTRRVEPRIVWHQAPLPATLGAPVTAAEDSLLVCMESKQEPMSEVPPDVRPFAYDGAEP